MNDDLQASLKHSLFVEDVKNMLAAAKDRKRERDESAVSAAIQALQSAGPREVIIARDEYDHLRKKAAQVEAWQRGDTVVVEMAEYARMVASLENRDSSHLSAMQRMESDLAKVRRHIGDKAFMEIVGTAVPEDPREPFSYRKPHIGRLNEAIR